MVNERRIMLKHSASKPLKKSLRKAGPSKPTLLLYEVHASDGEEDSTVDSDFEELLFLVNTKENTEKFQFEDSHQPLVAQPLAMRLPHNVFEDAGEEVEDTGEDEDVVEEGNLPLILHPMEVGHVVNDMHLQYCEPLDAIVEP
ncbi:hypothetical protein AMTR_s00027p00218520 [Amborella trichopoda]|uniref:Uncharacterized protein n=1 Tax=Amborella trichopoda TaxID=13333 RepID=W1PSG4_AMBTC|nr:hypothetical protein AMTR_s00027p00218520 [Amborella trichopoda]